MKNLMVVIFFIQSTSLSFAQGVSLFSVSDTVKQRDNGFNFIPFESTFEDQAFEPYKKKPPKRYKAPTVNDPELFKKGSMSIGARRNFGIGSLAGSEQVIFANSQELNSAVGNFPVTDILSPATMVSLQYYIKDFKYLLFDFGTNISNSISLNASNGNEIVVNSNSYVIGLGLFSDSKGGPELKNLTAAKGFTVYFETGNFNFTNNQTLVNEGYDYYRVRFDYVISTSVMNIGKYFQIQAGLGSAGINYYEYTKVITGNALENNSLVNRKITGLSYALIPFPGARMAVKIPPSKKK